MKQPRLVAVPCSVSRAREVVDLWHRHHGPSTSGLYAAAVATEDGVVRGVALIGRPVARLLDDGFTLEVTRVATDGTPNACAALYGIARRLAAALGYAKLITYRDMPGGRRVDKTEIVARRRWSLEIGEVLDLTWPRRETAQMELV